VALVPQASKTTHVFDLEISLPNSAFQGCK
jgi:hypothetical protein